MTEEDDNDNENAKRILTVNILFMLLTETYLS